MWVAAPVAMQSTQAQELERTGQVRILDIPETVGIVGNYLTSNHELYSKYEFPFPRKHAVFVYGEPKANSYPVGNNCPSGDWTPIKWGLSVEKRVSSISDLVRSTPYYLFRCN